MTEQTHYAIQCSIPGKSTWFNTNELHIPTLETAKFWLGEYRKANPHEEYRIAKITVIVEPVDD